MHYMQAPCLSFQEILLLLFTISHVLPRWYPIVEGHPLSGHQLRIWVDFKISNAPLYSLSPVSLSPVSLSSFSHLFLSHLFTSHLFLFPLSLTCLPLTCSSFLSVLAFPLSHLFLSCIHKLLQLFALLLSVELSPSCTVFAVVLSNNIHFS